MSNLQDQEKDLFIRKKLRDDELVSKKYDDVFESFLKGDHEMKEEQKNEGKKEKVKKQKNGWLKPFAAVAACTLIVTGANVYASTQGYDNIFFLIKDLGNKNKQVTATKDEILSDRDVTISYTNIEIANGLFIQINKFIIKDGKASLVVKVDQENAETKPEKFIITSNNVNLANEKITGSDSQYTREIKLNGYKEEMKLLTLKVEGANSKKITELEIDLENKEIDLLSGSENKEISKISEVDLKEKLGYYAILFNANATSTVLTDDEKFFLGSNLYIASTNESTKTTSDGYAYYPKEKLNAALKEAIGDELGTTIHSETFTYDKSIDGYKYIVAGDMSTSGLCLNIDDLKYEDERYVVKFTYCLPNEQDYYEGTIESLDRYQVTLEFLLNENEIYTKYQLLNIGRVEPKKIENNKSDELNKTNTNTISNTTIISNTNTNTNKNTNTIANTISSTNTTSNTIANTNIEHQHDYRIIAAEETGEYHTTIYGTHTLRCTSCGDEVQESHRFGKWYTINSGTAWTLWCEDCRQYVYTTDYDFVKNHLEYGMNSIINNTSTKPNYDPSTVNNYASTMNWTEHWAPGLKFQYPTEWDLSTTPKNVGNGLTVNADVNGWAIGKNPDTGEIIESSVLIEVYDQVIAFGNTPEEAYQNFADTYKFEENTGCYYTNNNGDEWHEFWNYGYFYDDMAGDVYYVHASALWDGGEPSGRYVIDIVRIATDNKNNFKVTNITNKIIGSLKTTSK